MKKFALGAFASLALASAAFAGPIFGYNRVNPPEQNPAGGQISAIASTYDTNTSVFTWNVSFSDGVAKDTDGYYLVVGPGPNPKGHAFEYAIIYFDASSLANPNVSIYRYNGNNDGTSFLTPGDLLASSRTPGQTTITSSASAAGGARTFNLTVNASAINALFNPPTTPQQADWRGIQYGQNIGVWFHPVTGLSTTYSGTSLTKFDFRGQGWLDTANERTFEVPSPASAALLGLGGLVAARRRRVA